MIEANSVPVRQLEVAGEYATTAPAAMFRAMADLLDQNDVDKWDEVEGVAFGMTEHSDGEPSTPRLSVFVHETIARMSLAADAR